MEAWEGTRQESERDASDGETGAETVETPATEASPSERSGESPQGSPSPSAPETAESSEPSSTDAPSSSTTEGDLLAGTSSEQAPGVGGVGDHPAPAAMIGSGGELRQHGEPADTAGDSAPAGDSADLQSGDVSPEAREKLDQPSEPEQVETDRPDIGTPE